MGTPWAACRWRSGRERRRGDRPPGYCSPPCSTWRPVWTGRPRGTVEVRGQELGTLSVSRRPKSRTSAQRPRRGPTAPGRTRRPRAVVPHHIRRRPAHRPTPPHARGCSGRGQQRSAHSANPPCSAGSNAPDDELRVPVGFSVFWPWRRDLPQGHETGRRVWPDQVHVSYVRRKLPPVRTTAGKTRSCAPGQ